MKVTGMTDAQVEKEMKKTLRVRAIGEADKFVGYYNHVRRRAGDVFVLRPIIRERNFIAMDAEDKPVMIYDARVSKGVAKRQSKVVIITAEQQFSAKWMERVTAPIPETKPVHFNKTKAGQGTLQNKLDIPGMTNKVVDGFDEPKHNVEDEDPTMQSDEVVI